MFRKFKKKPLSYPLVRKARLSKTTMRSPKKWRKFTDELKARTTRK